MTAFDVHLTSGYSPQSSVKSLSDKLYLLIVTKIERHVTINIQDVLLVTRQLPLVKKYK